MKSYKFYLTTFWVLFFTNIFLCKLFGDDANFRDDKIFDFLDLPYDQSVELKVNKNRLKKLLDLKGIANYAKIEDQDITNEAELLNFRMCSVDNSIFDITIFQTDDVGSASDRILLLSGLKRVSVLDYVKESYRSEYDDLRNLFILEKKVVEPKLWVLSLESGVLIQVSFNFNQQKITSPACVEVLLSQMKEISGQLIRFYNSNSGGGNITNGVYDKIKQNHKKISSLSKNYSEENVKSDYKILLEGRLGNEIPQGEGIIAGKKYLVRRLDGGDIPALKIFKPKELFLNVGDKSRETKKIADVEFRSFDGALKKYIEVQLTTDGLYEIRFLERGEQQLSIYTFDINGLLMERARLNVNVK